MTEELADAETIHDFLIREHNEDTVDCLGAAFHRLHSNNLIYGDLHPENILVSQKDRQKLYFLDCMSVGPAKVFRKGVHDLANFYFYAGRIDWKCPDAFLDRLLKVYCDCWPRGLKNEARLKREIRKEVQRKKSNSILFQLSEYAPF